MILTPRQIKTARTFLDWTQDDLASATGLNTSTIYKLESGKISPRGKTNDAICQAFEKAGLEIEPNGIRQRDETVRTYEGPYSSDNFFNDVLHTLREKGGEIVCGFRLSILMAQICDLKRGRFERLECLSEIATVKCLIGDLPEALPINPSFQIRTAPKLQIGATNFIEYGTKHAMVLIESADNFRFVVFHSAKIASGYREHFYSVWENAMQIPLPGIQQFQAGKNLKD